MTKFMNLLIKWKNLVMYGMQMLLNVFTEI